MATTLNKTKEVFDRLQEQKTILNTPSDFAKSAASNKHMEGVRREFQMKERASQIAASKVTLTA